METKYTKTANVFKALCDPNRLMVIDRLRGGEKCACELLEELKISQPTLSHHMKILCESGMINCRRDGKKMNYSLSKKGCEAACGLLTQMLDSAVLTDMEGSCDCE